MKTEKMIDALWHFFESVEDTKSMSTAQICADLVTQFDFDVEVLPPNLHANVMKIMGEWAYQSYINDKAESFSDDLTERHAYAYND